MAPGPPARPLVGPARNARSENGPMQRHHANAVKDDGTPVVKHPRFQQANLEIPVIIDKKTRGLFVDLEHFVPKLYRTSYDLKTHVRLFCKIPEISSEQIPLPRRKQQKGNISRWFHYGIPLDLSVGHELICMIGLSPATEASLDALVYHNNYSDEMRKMKIISMNYDRYSITCEPIEFDRLFDGESVYVDVEGQWSGKDAWFWSAPYFQDTTEGWLDYVNSNKNWAIAPPFTSAHVYYPTKSEYEKTKKEIELHVQASIPKNVSSADKKTKKKQ